MNNNFRLGPPNQQSFIDRPSSVISDDNKYYVISDKPVSFFNSNGLIMFAALGCLLLFVLSNTDNLDQIKKILGTSLWASEQKAIREDILIKYFKTFLLFGLLELGSIGDNSPLYFLIRSVLSYSDSLSFKLNDLNYLCSYFENAVSASRGLFLSISLVLLKVIFFVTVVLQKLLRPDPFQPKASVGMLREGINQLLDFYFQIPFAAYTCHVIRSVVEQSLEQYCSGLKFQSSFTNEQILEQRLVFVLKIVVLLLVNWFWPNQGQLTDELVKKIIYFQKKTSTVSGIISNFKLNKVFDGLTFLFFCQTAQKYGEDASIKANNCLSISSEIFNNRKGLYNMMMNYGIKNLVENKSIHKTYMDNTELMNMANSLRNTEQTLSWMKNNEGLFRIVAQGIGEKFIPKVFEYDTQKVHQLVSESKPNAINAFAKFFLICVLYQIWANSVVFTYSLNYIVYALFFMIRLIITGLRTSIGLACTQVLNRILARAVSAVDPLSE